MDNNDAKYVALAKAIAKKESGGNFNAIGDNGTSFGVGQWNNLGKPLKRGELPAVWREHASIILGDSNAQMTPENQKTVLTGMVKKLATEDGLQPYEIAAKWNSGSSVGWENKKGTTIVNGKKLAYDTPTYVKTVDQYFKENMLALGNTPQNQQLMEQAPAEPTIDELRAERQVQGLPVAVNPNKVEPNLFSNLVRGAIKPFASVGVGAKKAAFSLGGAIAGNDEALLKNDPTKAVKSKFLGDIYPFAYDKEGLNVKKGVGQLAEIASVGVGGGTVGGLGQVAKTGFKEGAKQALRASVPLIKEGAISGALGGFGTSLQNDENLGGVIRDTAIGAGIGAVATPVLSGATAVLGKGVGKVANRFSPDAQNLRYRAQELDELIKVENNYQKLRKNQTFNKNIDKIREQALDSGVLAGAVDETGTIKTADAIKKYRAMTLNDTENVVRDNLALSGETVRISDVEDYLLKKVMKSGIEGKELKTAINNIRAEVEGYRLRGDVEGNVPLTVLHDAKVGSYDLIDFNTPADVKKYQKTLAKGLKELVENNSKKFNVSEANKSLSEPLAVIKYLEDLDGRKVRGGKLGKYAAQISGNIVGGAAGSVFGPFGSAVGTVVGGEVAGAIKGNTLSKSLGKYTGKEIPKSKVLEKAVARTAPLRTARELEKSYSNSLGNLNTIYPNMITKNKNVIPKVSTETPKKASIPVIEKPKSDKYFGVIPKSFKGSIEAFKNEGDLTTKILKDLEGKTTVSKQYILDATNRGELKQVERDITRQVLETMKGDTINVKEFADKIKSELLPLKRNDDLNPSAMGGYKYENVTLPDELRGNVENYSENIYESPITTSAGEIHFSGDTKNYFGHTRIEDMADNKTRRVIEVQSDLYQKGNLEREIKEPIDPISNAKKFGFEVDTNNLTENQKIQLEKYQDEMKDFEKRKQEVNKLAQYNDPTAHFRMIREEIKKASQDGKTKLQFPTGETAMKIEGLGDSTHWYLENPNNPTQLRNTNTSRDLLQVATPENIKVGQIVIDENQKWIITDVLGDGKFKAVPKYLYENELKLTKQNSYIKDPETETLNGIVDNNKETFDISGKVDTNNPIYKFYEKDVQKYLNKFGGQKVIDDKGVSWIEIPITKEQGNQPVEAFGKIQTGFLLNTALGSAGAVGGLAGYKAIKEKKKVNLPKKK